jgi:hypothetical protein
MQFSHKAQRHADCVSERSQFSTKCEVQVPDSVSAHKCHLKVSFKHLELASSITSSINTQPPHLTCNVGVLHSGQHEPHTLTKHCHNHGRKQKLEHIGVVEIAVHNLCVNHKAKEDIPQQESTLFSQRNTECCKEDPNRGVEHGCLINYRQSSIRSDFFCGRREFVPICAQYLMFVWYVAEPTPTKASSA